MLEMRPNCECCDVDLMPSSQTAYICSFECTFCAKCAEDHFKLSCPTCSGTLVQRPTRSRKLQTRHPGSNKRVLKPHNCGELAAAPA